MFTVTNKSDEFVPLNELDLKGIDNFDIIVGSDASVLFMTNEGFNKTYIVMNKQHVDYKNIDNRRFPNRNIMRHVSPPSVVTVLDQIEFILDKVLTDNIKKDIDRRMNIKYNNLLSNSDNYNEEYDTPFKFSVYRDFAYKDENTQEIKYYRLESALACWATILNFKSIPLCKIQYHKEFKNGKEKFVGEGKYKRIVDNIINKLSSPRDNKPLVKLSVNRIKEYLIDNTNWSSYDKYLLYINGYATWLKEITENGFYKTNGNILNYGSTEYRTEEKLDLDIYTYVGEDKVDPNNIKSVNFLNRIDITKEELQIMFDYERTIRNNRSRIVL